MPKLSGFDFRRLSKDMQLAIYAGCKYTTHYDNKRKVLKFKIVNPIAINRNERGIIIYETARQ